MAVPFGFSVGEFVVGIGVIKDTIEAFSATKGATATYRDLSRGLENLQDSLQAICDLTLDSSQKAEFSRVEKAVFECQQCIHSFLQGMVKFRGFETQLSRRWSSKGLKRSLRKVQWALFKKEDVDTFRKEVQQHSNAIQMALTTFQL